MKQPKFLSRKTQKQQLANLVSSALLVGAIPTTLQDVYQDPMRDEYLTFKRLEALKMAREKQRQEELEEELVDTSMFATFFE